MVKEEDKSYIPTTSAGVGFHVNLSQAACKKRVQAQQSSDATQLP
jgi:hypothetical protein